MKRIGILTYHRATNYGAVLQSYALVNKIKHDFPNCDVSIIDYSTKRADIDHKKEILSNFVHSGWGMGVSTWKKNMMFSSFSDALPLTEYKCVSDKIKSVSDYMNNHFDIVISGSDAVFSWNGKKFPSAYLLGENGSYIKLSYAASAHRLAYREQPQEYIEYCRTAFNDYYYLGVRDSETEKFVRYCSNQVSLEHNCDPSFLIDLETIKKHTNLTRFSEIWQKKLIIVMTSNASVGKEIMDKFSDDYSIVSLFVKNAAIPNHLGDINPFEWATLFSKAVLTITEYFHATIFSLLNNTPVVSIDSSKNSTGYEGKIHDLMTGRLLLNDMYLNYQDIESSGVKVVSEAALKIMKNDYSDAIQNAINKEKRFYGGFYNALNRLVGMPHE